MNPRVKAFIEEYIDNIEMGDWKTFTEAAIHDLIDSHILEVFKSLKDAGVSINNEDIESFFNSVLKMAGEVIPLYNYNGRMFDVWDELKIRDQINDYLLSKLDTTIVIDKYKYSLLDIKNVLGCEYFHDIDITYGLNNNIKDYNLNFNLWLNEDDNWVRLLASVNIGELTGVLHDNRLGVYVPGFGFIYNEEIFIDIVNKIKGKLI